MKNQKQKKTETKNKNLTNNDFYKKHFIQSEFLKVMNETLTQEEDEGLLVLIKMILCLEMIEDFSDYGKKIIELDFTDYIKDDMCFLCFIKFRTDDYFDTMVDYYYSKLVE